jgi:hypothetical protein
VLVRASRERIGEACVLHALGEIELGRERLEQATNWFQH